MSQLTTWRGGITAALMFSLFLFAIAPLANAQGSTSTSQDAHHDGTPASTEMPAATAMPGMGMGMDDSTPAMGAMMQAEQFDLMFIDMMIMHHQGAVAMAEVAVEQGERPELVQLAEEIVSDQQAEIAQLRAWRDQWYPDAPTFSMDDMMGDMSGMMQGMPGMEAMGGMMGMMGMMEPTVMAEALRAAPDIDLAFINAMIPHHLSALMMAEMAIQQASRPELASLAQTMIDTQEEEIAQMRAWRAEWYGTAATPAS